MCFACIDKISTKLGIIVFRNAFQIMNNCVLLVDNNLELRWIILDKSSEKIA